jgi:hypothetical protein
MFAWHFVGKTLRNGAPIPPDGEWLEHDGKIIMCQSGLHASVHPFDALKYASGTTLCIVEVDGTIINDDDKLVASRRRIIARRDATTMLREFARTQALSVIHLWNAPDVVRQYLITGDETLRAAARAAAWAAASDAARAAAWDAAWGASWAAARASARDAAWTATWPAAWAAAWAAARASARDAAWTATWPAARDAVRADFEQRVNTLFANIAALDAAGGK